MILIDFRNWIFDKSFGFLPNAQKELLQKDFDTLSKRTDFNILNIGTIKPLKISSLFFKNVDQIAVSPVKNIDNYYEFIDRVLEIEDKQTIDYTAAADEEVYFYGEDSLVSHSASEIALCGINAFTDEGLFEEYCEDFELTPMSFALPDDLLTSDVALFVKDTLLVCLEFIKDKKTKKDLFSLLKSNQIKVVTVTKQQIEKGVLDMKFVENKLLMTKRALDLLTDTQKEQLKYFNIEIVDLPFLEKAGVKLRDVIA